MSPPIGKNTRPTAERVREAIASLLDARGAVEDARVLDLYAGTGALGFELLSRGAQHCVFVEKDGGMASFIKQGAKQLGVTNQVEVLRVDAAREAGFAHILAHAPYSLVVADPPYRDAQLAAEALAQLCARGLLAEDALLLLETSAKGIPALPASFELISQYRYGDTAVALFCSRASASASIPACNEQPAPEATPLAREGDQR